MDRASVSPVQGLQTSAGGSGRWQALAMLFLVGVFNYIDRQSIAILQVPIKKELGLSDAQLGALTGLSFALLYTSLGLPIARLADRYSRKLIIVAALAIWSLMTAGCGLAAGFMTLVLFRMGVAVGEAGCIPATHSLIADYFPQARRATAISIWALCLPFGVMLGFAAGGLLSERLGWRDTFLTLGAVGLALVPLVMLLLPEPQRGAQDVGPAPGAMPPVREALLILWRLRTFRHAAWAGALVAYVLYAVMNWNAPFYSRVFGLSIRELGLYLALIAGVGGGIGTALSGVFADRAGRRDVRWYLWVPALTTLAAVPFMLVQYLTADVRLSMIAGVVPATLLSAYMSPLVATVQSLMPANLRAFASAVLVLVVNVVGLGLGPLVTGVISDVLANRYGLVQDSLRYAIACSALFALWSGWHFWRAAMCLPQDLGNERAAQSGPDPGRSATAPQTTG